MRKKRSEERKKIRERRIENLEERVGMTRETGEIAMRSVIVKIGMRREIKKEAARTRVRERRSSI